MMLRGLLIFVTLLAATASAQVLPRLTGRVTDGSGGALPGVTVTIASDRIGAPVVLVTDEVGRYNSPPLPAGTYAVSFELSGFEPQTRERIVLGDGEVVIMDRQLVVGSVTESVEVVAAAPPPPAAFPRFEPPPPLRTEPVPKELLASVCGPGSPEADNLSFGIVLGHRDDKERHIFGASDVLVLDIGADFGATVGQNYVVRRRFRVGDKHVPLAQASFGEQTAGLIQIVQTTPEHSIAVVVYACGELYTGDTLEAFDPLPALSARTAGAPQFDEPAHIIFGEHGQMMGAPKQLMVIDRGRAGGALRGQRLTVFRRVLGERGPVSRIADGVVVAVREKSATIRIERATDAVTVGDLVALYR
ncbi:MAG TPA: carboxypeptidase-like regulatory domain-containing protein [Vicinamibacterales bacterium]|nr:carboxypeptidase-like regulatory domain-containing protein [Vicinamibacterales bacterium]